VGNQVTLAGDPKSMAGKWLDFLKQAVPGLTRVAVIFNPDTSPQSKLFVPVIKASASPFAVEVIVTPVHAIADVEPTIANVARHPNSGLIFLSDQFTIFAGPEPMAPQPFMVGRSQAMTVSNVIARAS
jgi:putative ABC transport system substrate-binding protein